MVQASIPLFFLLLFCAVVVFVLKEFWQQIKESWQFTRSLSKEQKGKLIVDFVDRSILNKKK